MRLFGPAAMTAAAALSLCGQVTAGELVTKPVVELFTSQGCSSCPPADRLIGTMAERDSVIALTYHVDYWDYLGWRDTLAKREFSERQRNYAARRKDGAVYTPQIVINGGPHVVGSDGDTVERLLSEARANTDTFVTPRISAERNGGIFKITIARSEKPVSKNLTVFVASVTPEVSVSIARGENRGKTIEYHNVVTKLVPVGSWSGEETVLKLDASTLMSGKEQNCAVLIQDGDDGQIYAAAWLEA